MQKLLLCLAKQSYSFDQFARLIDNEKSSTKDFISHELKQLEIAATETKYQDDFLATLQFPEINCRQEEIKDAHKETFQWIFDQSGEKVRPWTNFIDWLKDGSGTYWISGKPGSGKSTLMNYICQDERTTDVLGQWAGSRKLMVPTFFFWTAGTQLQRSVSGLLRSLIYQILEANRWLIMALGQRNSAFRLQAHNLQGPEAHTVWTEKRLLTCFSTIVKKISESHGICFFIDGLDEVEGDHYELIEIIVNLTDREGIKCCVSSRPEKPFQDFGSSSMLRLQDLTRLDIKGYVWSKLRALPQIANLSAEGLDPKVRLLKSVVDKADGVFLWVELVVKHQIIGIRFNDSFEMLQQRLNSLPPKVEDLYSNMLERIDPAHHREAANYLCFTMNLDQRMSSVFNFSLAVHGLTDNMRLKPEGLVSNKIISECPHVHDRVNGICAGFLETYGNSDDQEAMWITWEQDPSSLAISCQTDWSRRLVRFCHRTAYDFFKGGNGWRFVKSSRYNTSNEFMFQAAMHFAKMSLCNISESTNFVRRLHFETMMSLREAESFEKDTGALTEYVAYVGKSIAAFNEKFNQPLENYHWCSRWEVLADWKDQYWVPGSLDRRIGVKADDPQTLPNDFLSFAASFGLLTYVNAVLDQPDFSMDSNKATHLAICSITRPYAADTWRKWRIYSWPQFAFVARLVRSGANPRRGAKWSLWEEVLAFLYSEKVSGSDVEASQKHPHIMSDLPQILEAFLNTGVDLYPIIYLRYFNFEGTWLRSLSVTHP